MKRSKTSGSSKKKRRSSSKDRRPKRYRSRSPSHEKEPKKRKTRLPRQTRWSRSKSPVKESVPKTVPPVKEPKKEPDFSPALIKVLDDKENLVEQLFLAVTGSDLEELIPHYLKKQPIDQLKKMCLEQAQLMSKEFMLHIIAGKDPKSFEIHKAEVPEKDKDPKQRPADSEKKNEDLPPTFASKRLRSGQLTFPRFESSPVPSEGVSSDTLELYPSSKEMESIDEENQAPSIVSEDVSKEFLQDSLGDLELLELEMRARAIRSLLRAKGLPSSDDDECTGNKGDQ